MKSIFVFKTSVAGNAEVNSLKPLLNNLINGYGRWNFDLEDCDNILRVEARKLKAIHIASVLRLQGFQCEELPD